MMLAIDEGRRQGGLVRKEHTEHFEGKMSVALLGWTNFHLRDYVDDVELEKIGQKFLNLAYDIYNYVGEDAQSQYDELAHLAYILSAHRYLKHSLR